MTGSLPTTMRQWVLASRPDGPAVVDNFSLQTVPVPEIGDGEVLIKTLYLGVAPVMLRYMTNETSFERPMAIGDVMIGRGVGRVVATRNPAFRVGEIYQAKLGLRDAGKINGSVSLAEALGGGLGIFVTGVVHDMAGGYPAAFTVVCGVMFVGLVMILGLRPPAMESAG